MQKHNHIVIIVFVFLVLLQCGTSLYVNESYIFPQEQESFQLAILPVEGTLGVFADTVFTVIFEDSTHRQELVALQEIRGAFQSNRPAVEVLNKLLRTIYSPDENRERSNLTTILSSREFAVFQEVSQQADILFIPVVLDVRSQAMHTFGDILFRIYDLHSGELILEGHHHFNVNQVGEYAARDLTVTLIAYAWGDYDQHYYQRFFQ